MVKTEQNAIIQET